MPTKYRVLGTQPGMVNGSTTTIVSPQNGKPTILFLLLATSIGRKISVTEIHEVVWAGATHSPLNPRNAIQGLISNLRSSEIPVKTDKNHDSYYLPGDTTDVDALLLAQLASSAKRELASGAAESALAQADAALQHWSGPIMRSFSESSRGTVISERFQVAHDVAVLAKAQALVALRRPQEAVDLVEGEIHQGDLRDPEAWTELIRAVWANGDRDRSRAILGNAEIALRKAGTPIPDSLVAVGQMVRDRSLAIVSDEPSEGNPRVTVRELLPHDSQLQLDRIDPADVHEQLLTELLDNTPCHPNFHVFFVSGVSAAGKDTIVALAHDRVAHLHRFEVLRKYTTRPKRTGEQEYSISVDDSAFESLLRSGQVAFPYVKRTALYGFDALQLTDAMRRGGRLVAVFTEVDQLPTVANAMTARLIENTPIFVEADFEYVVDRTRFRGFTDLEMRSRVESIRQDFSRMARRPDFSSEYRFVKNGNNRALEDAISDFLEIVESVGSAQSRNTPKGGFVTEVGKPTARTGY